MKLKLTLRFEMCPSRRLEPKRFTFPLTRPTLPVATPPLSLAEFKRLLAQYKRAGFE